jgi:2-polyprenyl-3-methyl-5-hydroxy-6-metoxy-1,4-benzoquinol methylase
MENEFVQVSRTFKTSHGRHELINKNVAYCAFDARSISVSENNAQRSARKRLENFGVIKSLVEGKTILDLGAHYGAMLFQLTNLGIQSGLGVEFDEDKVSLARKIAKKYDFNNLEFICSNLDEIHFSDLGKHDIVLSLSIEKHVADRSKLYRLIGECTKHICFFEGNANCNLDITIAQLQDVGFVRIDFKGFCQDDIRPQNNRRPCFVAYK